MHPPRILGHLDFSVSSAPPRAFLTRSSISNNSHPTDTQKAPRTSLDREGKEDLVPPNEQLNCDQKQRFQQINKIVLNSHQWQAERPIEQTLILGRKTSLYAGRPMLNSDSAPCRQLVLMREAPVSQ